MVQIVTTVSRRDFYIGFVIFLCVYIALDVSFHTTTNYNSKIDYAVTVAEAGDEIPRKLGTNFTNHQDLVAALLQSIPIGIPPGQAEALPSVRVIENTDAVDQKRSIYGGKGDKAHLGGFTEIDLEGISPAVWKLMITKLGVHSVLDVGCGRGISTAWFALHGCNVLCAEGSHDAVQRSVLPDVANQVVEHDFSRGPWWPGKTYDAVWSVEFLEHVGVQYHYNYIAAFRKCALIFVTSSSWGGWHHVEVHQDDWWIQKYESYGFRYDAKLTHLIRETAREEGRAMNTTAPNGKHFGAAHVIRSMKVFINPLVASLPTHAHLFPEHGCFKDYGPNNGIIQKICGTGWGGELETPLPKEFVPIELTPEMDTSWDTLVKKHINISNVP